MLSKFSLTCSFSFDIRILDRVRLSHRSSLSIAETNTRDHVNGKRMTEVKYRGIATRHVQIELSGS